LTEASPPAATPPPVEVPTWFKAGVMLGSAVLGLVGAELIVRIGSGGALPHLRLFVQDGPVIGLEPDACADVRHAAGHGFTVCADAAGRRSPSADPGAWLVVGDSQVLGMGVDGDEAFPAVNGWTNGGVPGHGLADALATAERHIAAHPPAGLVVVINQANDWEEALVPAGERYQVAGGLLLRAGSATGWGATFWDSPLSRLQLLSYVALLASAPRVAADAAPPAWMADPAGQEATSRALAGAIEGFARSHPELTVVTAFLPVDVAISAERVPSSPFGRYAGSVSPAPWEDRTLRDQLRSILDPAAVDPAAVDPAAVDPAARPVRFVDLGATLAETPGAFLDADYHLSAAGHVAVAAELQRATQ
jgi:hypothetical protein